MQFAFYYIKQPKAGGEAWCGVLWVLLLGLSVLGIGVDFLIQYITPDFTSAKKIYFKNGLGLLPLIGFYYFISYKGKSLTIIIPNDFKDMIGIVYNYTDSKRLYRNPITLNAKVNLPDSGIVFTSSKKRFNDLPFTKFKTKSGKEIHLSGRWSDTYSDEIELEVDQHLLSVQIFNLGNPENGKAKILAYKEQIINQIRNS